MASRIAEVMSRSPVIVPSTTTLLEAAQLMRDHDIGDVIVQDGDDVQGIVTDRDIVVRGIADEGVPDEATVGEICSTSVITVGPDDPIGAAVQLMRENAVRRLPVTEGAVVVGVVSLGDLAVEQDRTSALAEISRAEPNS